MSLVLDPAALERVLHSPLGMVGVFVERKTNKIAIDLAISASGYFGSAPGLAQDIADDVSVEMDGSTGVVKVKPGGTGSKWTRLADMALGRSRTPWREGPKLILDQNKF